ncbi:hypothetical protein J4466_01695 [Candidatus Pacearchaeota archaeon]|nr:hypothetical protein [Candidatus Pacearchaeota archaeon]
MTIENQVTREMTEEETMVYGTNFAVQSLVMPSERKAKGKVYIVSDTRYNTFPVGEGTIAIHFSQGREIPNNNLEAFIEEKSKEPDVLGLVPITQKSFDLMTKKGLKIKLTGATLSPENYQAVVFGL